MNVRNLLHNKDGQSVLEVIIALAIFSLIAAAMVSMVTGSFTALKQGGEHTEAEALAQEAIEAIRSIRDNAWNTNTYTTSSVSVNGDEWIFDGEGTTETIGNYTRTISFADVCRDGIHNIVPCPGSYTDVYTKLATVQVSWEPRIGVTNTVERVAYMTNWDSKKWIQTDWSGGDGQSIWSDTTMYESDDGGVDVSSTPGVLQLASIPRQEACLDTHWSFDTPSNYTYNNVHMQVANGKASLTLVGATASSTWPFSSSTLYSFDQNSIEVTGGYGQLVYVGLIASTTWQFDTPENYTYSTSSISVTSSAASLTPVGGILGEIQDIIIDTLEFDGSTGLEMDMVHVTGTVWAISYRGAGNDGFLKTVTIGTNGTIGSILDTEEFDTADGRENRILKVGDNMVALIYRGPGSDGWIKTHSVSDLGIISDTPIDTLEYDTSTGLQPEVIHISADVYAIVFRGDGNDGWVKTVRIGTDGSLDASFIDSLEFETADTRDAQISHVTGTIYAIVYEHDGSNDGWITTVDIQANGAIGASVIDSYEYDGSNGRQPTVQRISDTIVAVVYRGDGGDGYVQTIEIDGSGNITASPVDTFEYDTLDGSEPDIIPVSDDVYAIAFADPGDEGWVSTVDISSAGTITPSTIDSFLYNTESGNDPRIRHIDGNIYGIVHQGSGTDGWLTTISIQSEESYDDASPAIQPVSSYQDPQDVQVWSNFVTNETLNGGSITYQLSEDDGATWLYWSGASWVTASTSSESNTASSINANISSFPTSTNNLMFKAFLNSDGSQNPELDAVSITAIRSTSGYPSTNPSIYPTTVLGVADIRQWSSFVAVENTTGTVYYQLSDDAGSTWQYWNGASWATAVGASDMNISTAIDSNISTFNTSTKQILFRAFFESDGLQQVQLDSVSISWIIPPPDDNVMGLWHMDEVSGLLVDQSGNGNDLSVNGTPIYSSSGKFGTAIDFDDVTGDYAEITDAAQTGLDFSDAMTIEAWVNKTSSGNDYIVRKWTSGGDRSYYVQARNNGSVRFRMRNGSNDVQLDTGTGLLQTGQWHHIAAVYDGTTAYLFVDGVLGDSASYSADIQNGAAPFGISDSNSFQGRIDEVRVSNVARWTSNFTPPGAPYGDAILAYSTDRPTIEPVDSYTPAVVDQWTSFIASSTLNGGTIYFQLSHDDGDTWKYWDGSLWATSTLDTHFNTTTPIHTNIWQFPTSPSGTIKFKAFFESDGTQLVELDDVAIGCTNLQYEVGTVFTDESWESVSMQNIYEDPVIVASVLNSNSSSTPASVRVRNVTTSTFDIRIHNPSDADLSDDLVTYLVMEKGKWTIDNIDIEANTHDTATIGYKSNWTGDGIAYGRVFDSAPVVMHTVMSENDSTWITSLVSASGTITAIPGTTDMWLGLNGAEAVTSHGLETIGWIAMDPNETGAIGSTAFETNRTSDSVNGFGTGCYTYAYQNSFSSTPASLVFQQEMDGNDGSWGVMCSNTSALAGMAADEDQVTDSERSHTTETFAFVAWSDVFSTSTLASGGGLYKTAGMVTSSAFFMNDASPVQAVEWDEILPSGTDIQLQIRTASDAGGSPGTWTSWYGASGAGTYFTSPSSTLVSPLLNWNRWVQYRVELSGDGTDTPVLSEVRVDYK